MSLVESPTLAELAPSPQPHLFQRDVHESTKPPLRWHSATRRTRTSLQFWNWDPTPPLSPRGTVSSSVPSSDTRKHLTCAHLAVRPDRVWKHFVYCKVLGDCERYHQLFYPPRFLQTGSTLGWVPAFIPSKSHLPSKTLLDFQAIVSIPFLPVSCHITGLP